MKPVYVGPKPRPKKILLTSENRYCLATEMAEIVSSLTGFYHPGFKTFEDVLGREIPETGSRSVSRPSVLSFLCLRRIAWDTALAVCEREGFCLPEERLVFKLFSPSSLDVSEDVEWQQRSLLWQDAFLSPMEQSEKNATQRVSNLDMRDQRKIFLANVLSHGGLYTY